MKFGHRTIFMIVISFSLGLLVMFLYHFYWVHTQSQSIGRLISSSRELFNLQKSINLADSDAYNTFYDCTFNLTTCDQKAGAERLERLREGRNLMTDQVDKLSQDIELIIKANHWNDYGQNHN